MSDFGRCRTVTARQPHTCGLCGGAIAVGESHVHWTGRYEGEWTANRYHSDCHEWGSANLKTTEDWSIEPGEYLRGRGLRTGYCVMCYEPCTDDERCPFCVSQLCPACRAEHQFCDDCAAPLAAASAP
jgi:hypothetical protein